MKIDHNTAWTHYINSQNEELRFVKSLQWKGVTSTAVLYAAIIYIHDRMHLNMDWLFIIILNMILVSALLYFWINFRIIQRRREGQRNAFSKMPDEIKNCHVETNRSLKKLEDDTILLPLLLVIIVGFILTLSLIIVGPPDSGKMPAKNWNQRELFSHMNF